MTEWQGRNLGGGNGDKKEKIEKRLGKRKQITPSEANCLQ